MHLFQRGCRHSVSRWGKAGDGAGSSVPSCAEITQGHFSGKAKLTSEEGWIESEAAQPPLPVQITAVRCSKLHRSNTCVRTSGLGGEALLGLLLHWPFSCLSEPHTFITEEWLDASLVIKRSSQWHVPFNMHIFNLYLNSMLSSALICCAVTDPCFTCQTHRLYKNMDIATVMSSTGFEA